MASSSPKLVLLALPLLSLTACTLIGVEPDEIDIAEDSGETGGEEGMGTSANTGTGGTGDGDGDPGDGDGDADATDTGDGDTGGTGDGDGDPIDSQPCASLEPTAIELGTTPITLAAGPSMTAGSCGFADGPEAVFSFTSVDAASVELGLSGFDAALYLADPDSCLPLVELGCVATPATLMVDLGPGETVYFVIDAATADGGMGELTLM